MACCLSEIESWSVGAVLAASRQGYGGALVVEGRRWDRQDCVVGGRPGCCPAGGFPGASARGAELEREYTFRVVRQLFEPALATATEQERAGLRRAARRGGPAAEPSRVG